MLDRLTSMAAFVKTVDLGSFTAAGAALGLSSQMIGKHVASLEERLNAPLLRRSTRRQSLTEVGQLFYERCRIVLSEAEAAETLVEGMSAAPRGRLRVNAPVAFGAGVLAPVIADFLDRHPGIEVELTLTDRYVDIVDEGYDAVLRLGPIGDTNLVARELVSHDQIACASPDYIARHGAPERPGDLDRHDCLAFVNWSGLPYAEWRFAKDGVTHSVRIRSRFQVNDGRVLVAAAIAGRGIILQPVAILRDAIADGRLVPVLRHYVPPSRPLYLVFARRTPQPPKLRAFIDCVVAEMGVRSGDP
ncbi:LysR family transcriptional regulator [Sphingomonas abietis]|uniref:LysR family transcriptional regulator n=1 Tax=Sphingomonas abietis TaxID=3012344 RepID=A0ABY7NJ24_9SPHN|nr:LysR family transcriptional regulator [Sphingomonas abietis]WBO21535.1 LysR family transcriptional regulator [Sphingomonas abietis]